MSWYVFRCPDCGNWGVRELRGTNYIGKTFLCKICGKSTRIKKAKDYGLNLTYKGGYNSQPEALAVITDLKSREGDSGFFEYKRKKE